MRPEGGVGAAEWETHYIMVCPNVCCLGRYLCNPRYSGEYKLNYISLFNFPILRRIWSYILEEVPSAASSKGDMWLWLLGHLLPCATKYSSKYLFHGYNHVLLHTLSVYLFSTSY